jgi:hypothetical protein
MNFRELLRPALVAFCLVFLSCAHSAARQAKESQDTPSTIVVNVNRVLVPVVVRDKQGRAVADLKKEDFQVFDNGKPQLISGFTVEKSEATKSNTDRNAEIGKQSPATPSPSRSRRSCPLASSCSFSTTCTSPPRTWRVRKPLP